MVYHLGRGLEGLLGASREQIDDLHDPPTFDMNDDFSSATFMDSLFMMDSFYAHPELFGMEAIHSDNIIFAVHEIPRAI